jgi:hypothetical protein
MARILYYSVHEVLEYDDLRIFASLGHSVFSMGAFCDPSAKGLFRSPELSFSSGADYADFRSSGGMMWNGEYGAINPEFAKRFDFAIVNNMPQWIAPALAALGDGRVIYRTIGQSTLETEASVAPYRHRIKVVRYSEAEAKLPGFMTNDAIVYFGKFACDYEQPWEDGATVLTFHNDYQARSPSSVPRFDEYVALAKEYPLELCGRGNEAAANFKGFVPVEAQLQRYRRAAAYLYVPTTAPSYTLNLMEAMLSGVPILAPSLAMLEASYDEPTRTAFALADRYEVPALLDHDRDVLFDTLEDAKLKIARLLMDTRKRRELSVRVKAKALSLFNAEAAAHRWNNLFTKVMAEGVEI